MAILDSTLRVVAANAAAGRFLRTSVDELGQTVVMVTHEARAAAIADRILFLADGNIVRDLAGASQADVLATMNEIAAAAAPA